MAKPNNLQTNMLPDFTGDLACLLDPRRRFDVKFLVDVSDGVLNGDPDNEAKQRVNERTGRGVATDVCFKRFLRDTMMFLLENGYAVRGDGTEGYLYGLYMQHRGILNANHQEVYKACGVQGYEPAALAVPDKLVASLVVDDDPVALPHEAYALKRTGDKWSLAFDGTLNAEAREEAAAAFGAISKGLVAFLKKLHKESKISTVGDADLAKLVVELARRYWDVRMFGVVGSTGDSCGNVKGPFQVGQAHSYDVIEASEQCITRQAVTRIEDVKDKRQDMGRKCPIAYALFGSSMFYNPGLARRVGSHGVIAEDLRLFWTSLYNFGRFAGSSMRGHVEIVGAYVFVHDHPLGNAHSHALLARVQAAKKAGVAHPEKFEDYDVTVDDADMPEGVRLVRLYERKPKTTTPPEPVVNLTGDRNGAAHKKPAATA